MGRKRQVPVTRGLILTLSVFTLLLTGCSESGDASSINGSWEPRSIPGQNLTDEFPSTSALLVLKDGNFSATDGCNRDFEWTGTYELTGKDFEVKVDAYSIAGVDCALGLLFYPEVLEQARSATMEDGRLVLRDKQGSLVGEFAPV